MVNHYVTKACFRPTAANVYNIVSFFVVTVTEMTAIQIYTYLQEESIKNLEENLKEKLKYFGNDRGKEHLKEIIDVTITLLKSEP